MSQGKEASKDASKPIANFTGVPQHTNFYAGFFQAFCNPFAFQFPYPETGEDKEDAPSKPRSEAEQTRPETPQQPGLDHAEEAHDVHLEEWVMVEEDLGKDWISIQPKGADLAHGSSIWRGRAGWHTHDTTDV